MSSEKISIAHNLSKSAQVKGGPEKYENGQIEKAAEIVGKRASRTGIQYRMTWEGYDMTYDTWERSENVVDKSLIDHFEASINLSIPVNQLLFKLREEVAKCMMKIKHPAWLAGRGAGGGGRGPFCSVGGICCGLWGLIGAKEHTMSTWKSCPHGARERASGPDAKSGLRAQGAKRGAGSVAGSRGGAGRARGYPHIRKPALIKLQALLQCRCL